VLAPFSTPSRSVAILILPGGLLRFQIGEATGVSADCSGISAYGAGVSAYGVVISAYGVSVSAYDARVSAYGFSHRRTYRPRPRLMIDHGIGVIAHGTGMIDHGQQWKRQLRLTSCGSI
jgi:hypothetical protein